MKTILGFIALIGLLAACDRTTDVQPAPTGSGPAADVPVAVTSSLKRVFPEAQLVSFSEIEKNKVWGARFVADTLYSATLNATGSFYTIYRRINAGKLPPLAKQFIGSGQTIREAYQQLSEQRVGIGYVAVVANANDSLTTYQFNLSGQPQNTIASGKAVPRDSVYTAPLFSYSLTADELPDAIRQYQSANLPDFTISQAFVLTVAGAKTFFVIWRKGDTYAQRYFDAQGRLLPAGPRVSKGLGPDEKALAVSDVPQATREMLSLYYPGWQFVLGTSSNDNSGRSLIIRVDYLSYLLLFDQAWKLVAVYKQ